MGQDALETAAGKGDDVRAVSNVRLDAVNDAAVFGAVYHPHVMSGHQAGDIIWENQFVIVLVLAERQIQ